MDSGCPGGACRVQLRASSAKGYIARAIDKDRLSLRAISKTLFHAATQQVCQETDRKSRRTHCRSDAVVTQVRRSVPWYRRYRWGLAVFGFLAAVLLTQIVIWFWSPFAQEQSALCVARVTYGDTFPLCDGDRVRLVAASVCQGSRTAG